MVWWWWWWWYGWYDMVPYHTTPTSEVQERLLFVSTANTYNIHPHIKYRERLSRWHLRSQRHFRSHNILRPWQQPCTQGKPGMVVWYHHIFPTVRTLSSSYSDYTAFNSSESEERKKRQENSLSYIDNALCRAKSQTQQHLGIVPHTIP